MPPRSLEDHDIYVRREGTLESISDCASQLTDLFTLVLSIQSLDWDSFGDTMMSSHPIRLTSIIQYEQELKTEAERLAEICHCYKRPDDIEDTWVGLLQPIVFYRFDTEQEEGYARKRHHHCFICGKHFPLRSRPHFIRRTPRSYEAQLLSVHGDNEDLEDADVCTVHTNVPNFDTGKFAYRGFEGEDIKRPDLTVGLLFWTENNCYAPPGTLIGDMDPLLQHDLVRTLCPQTLNDLEGAGLIDSLFVFPKGKKGTFVHRVSRPSLNFPFVIWEAKKSSEGDPFAQNALKIKKILQWQQNLAHATNITWVPVVFHFVSVGSEWKLYVCHAQKSERNDTMTYLFRLLWSGDCANKTKALQLLYLIDIIALWGQFQYKPFAATCIRILKKKNKGELYSKARDGDLLQHQKAISPMNFRSLQRHQRHAVVSPKSNLKLQRAGTATSEAEMERQIRLGLRALSLLQHFLPVRDGFIWLLHREVLDADLLVIRVNTAGKVLPALVIFNSSNWESPSFEEIIHQEKEWMPQNVQTDFRYNKSHTSVLEKCFNPSNGYCTESEIQFCAIVPIAGRVRMVGSHACPQQDIRPLEQLLGLEVLIDAAESANVQWCECKGPESDGMIQCDFPGCKTGWYHFKCVGLPEDYTGHDWFCNACKRSNNLRFAKYNDGKIEDDIQASSDERIQRVRSLARVWKNHKWPDASDVRNLMYRTICRQIEMDTDQRKFGKTVERLEHDRLLGQTQTWAILREDPSQITRIKQRLYASEQRQPC